jgi:hypothetical protein
MLTFEELRSRLLESLRARVRNGEITERRLARVTGISQPHIHNLLKGVRALTPELGDQILSSLQMSLDDFLAGPLPVRRESQAQKPEPYRYINMLNGLIGPSHPWPSQVSVAEKVKFTDPRAVQLVNPVAARAADDARMKGVFSMNDVAVLDQSLDARNEVDPDALYLIREGNCGLIRRSRITSTALYVFAEDCRHRSSTWQRIRLSAIPITQTLKARVLFPNLDDHWDAGVA